MAAALTEGSGAGVEFWCVEMGPRQASAAHRSDRQHHEDHTIQARVDRQSISVAGHEQTQHGVS